MLSKTALLLFAATTASFFDGSDAVVYKKGLGLTSKFGQAQLTSLNASWYYNWGSSPNPGTIAEFIPMIFSSKHVNDTLSAWSPYLLGFNEPDSAQQSNTDVSTALAYWPYAVANAKKQIPPSLISAPVMAENPVTGTWLPTIMSASPPPTVDFICVHWYKGPDAAKFKSDIQAVINMYQKPVWVTEFAPQTTSSGQAAPTKYTQAQVYIYIHT